MVPGQALVFSDAIKVRAVDKIYVRGLIPFATDLALELGFHASPGISDCLKDATSSLTWKSVRLRGYCRHANSRQLLEEKVW